MAEQLQQRNKLEMFVDKLALGGTIGAVAKTIMSPMERVKILLQTMDSNPKVVSGEVKRYTGAYDNCDTDCCLHVPYKECQHEFVGAGVRRRQLTPRANFITCVVVQPIARPWLHSFPLWSTSVLAPHRPTPPCLVPS